MKKKGWLFSRMLLVCVGLFLCLPIKGMDVWAEENHANIVGAIGYFGDYEEFSFYYEPARKNGIYVIHYSGNEAEVTIPQKVRGKTVTGIGGGAFEGTSCENLRTVRIPKSVRWIGLGAFAGFYKCDNLKDVYYAGSKKDWSKISIQHYSKDSDSLWNATIHCTDGDCKADGKELNTSASKGISISSISSGQKAFTIKWSKQKSEISGYEIQYSQNSNFKNAKKVKNIKSSVTSKKVSGLKSKKKYYVRIRTYKKSKSGKQYSKWSKSKMVTTK